MEQSGERPSRGKQFGRFLLKMMISSIAVYATSWLLPGVHIDQFIISIIVAFSLGLVNTFLRPVLIYLTIPLTIFSLGLVNTFLRPVLIYLTIPLTIFSFGLFLIVINAGLVILVSRVVPGFRVDGFWWAIAFSLILSIITGLLEIPVKRQKEK